MRYRLWRRGILFVLALGMMVAGGVSRGVATAQPEHTAGNPIWCGLVAGSNIDISASPTCTLGTPPTPPPASQPPTPIGGYVALGDSVAAGLGLASSPAATASDVQCGRSPQAYPTIVANSLHVPVTNIACSGATAGDLFTKQSVSGPNIPAQLDTAFANGTPGLITITAGANDAHWADFIRACYAFDCTASGYSVAAHAYLTILTGKLAYALADIDARSNFAPPTVVITGYYDPLSNACLSQDQHFSAAEIAWLRNETADLNTTIQNIADQYSFVRFAPVDFTGHDICSTDSWVQGPAGAAPFHPTAAGQQAIAGAVIQTLE